MTVDANAQSDAAEDRLRVLAAFTFDARPEEHKGSRDPVVSIGCEVLVTYSCRNLSKHSDAALQDFARNNGCFNAYPYWREFVQNSIARLGLPTLVIPTFRLDAGAEDASAPRRTKPAKTSIRKHGGVKAIKKKAVKKKTGKKTGTRKKATKKA
jgi:hypothetical protein